jgi:polysaccharide deacetylase family protein (PEP-CTERM system associated)
MEHYRASDQTRDAFLQDVTTAKHALEDAGGVEVRGYRAASFSIGVPNWWAFEVLEEAGYRYSSSISAGHRAATGLCVPDGPFRPGAGRLVEYPITTRRVLRRHLPTGGGFFRLLPRSIFHGALRKLNDSARPGIFYIHPWEFDPGQPPADVGMRVRFRHNVNIDRVPQKFSDLLASFRWGRLEDVFDDHLACEGGA